MAKEEQRIEPKFTVPGGYTYSNICDFDEQYKSKSIHELYFNAYQNLVEHIGLHTNMEIGLHIKITKEPHPYTEKPGYYLRCKIETIPIIEENYRYLKSMLDMEPYTPYNRKCTLKERLKILFKGEL